MKSSPRLILFAIYLVTLLSFFVSLPDKFNFPSFDYQFSKQNVPILNQINLPLKTGLDIQGGSHIQFQAGMEQIKPADRDSAIEALKNTIENRVNLLGVSEAVVQTAKVNDQYRLIVELPGVTETSQAIELIGQTAQLEFRRPSTDSPRDKGELEGVTDGTSPKITETDNTDDNLAIEQFSNEFSSTNLTGADLNRAQVDFDPNNGNPVIAIEFNSEGTDKFADLTTELVGRPLAIYLDNQLISAPVVNTAISTGQAIITGNFTIDEAKHLAIQLNSGALPVPIELISQSTVGPTLGQDTINRSIRAGLIGLGLVILFMAGYYGYLGILADIGLIIYGILTLAIYKILGITLTLPGIAGFVLSVGMAVDANILIFERYKEEIRQGRSPKLAIELAFGRAWDSIRDANVTTLIATFILFNPLNWSFLNTSGPVRGFALTLALGIVISLFTGIVVTRTLIRVFFTKGQ